MKILTIVGARPQFVKAAVLSREIRKQNLTPGRDRVEETIVHTGQHYDHHMSQIFFDELDIPKPKYHLGIGGLAQGASTGRMLEEIESVIQQESPDLLVVYGDTNSTLAGALAAAKMHVPIAHIEAGLRSFNRKMPEEINRVLTDHVSSILFCPTETAVQNLAAEGITGGVLNVGDIMFDACKYHIGMATEQSQLLEELNVSAGAYVLATCHRAENTDEPARLEEICRGLATVAKSLPVVFPLHPRTKKMIESFGFEEFLDDLIVVDPLPYVSMLLLEKQSKVIVTDSGGVQKEAYFFEVPCITLRDETEWIETVEEGSNEVVGASCSRLVSAMDNCRKSGGWKPLFGDGRAATRILTHLDVSS